MNELTINLIGAACIGLTCGAIANCAYKMGKTDATIDMTIGYLLDMSDRDMTALDLLDAFEELNLTPKVGFHNLYPALNRIEKFGVIRSYMKGGRKYYTKQQQTPVEQSPSP